MKRQRLPAASGAHDALLSPAGKDLTMPRSLLNYRLAAVTLSCWPMRNRIQSRIRIHPALSHQRRIVAPAIEHRVTARRCLRLLGRMRQALSPLRGHHRHSTLDRLVEQVMSLDRYRSARCLFWFTDNGSSHFGLKAANRLRADLPSGVLVHTRSMPVGSIQSKSTSPLSSARPLPPMISSFWLTCLSRPPYKSLVPCAGLSPAATFITSSTASTFISFARPPDPALGIRNRNCENAGSPTPAGRDGSSSSSI